jgi:lauroyl/myristoyl acyltransferase
MRLDSLAIAATLPIAGLRRRLPLLERALGLEFTDETMRGVESACRYAGVPLGAYYHWYLQKRVLLSCLRRMHRTALLALVARLDGSDYVELDRTLEDPRGVILAIPHYGHYILSIVAAIDRLRARRRVLVFYASPAVRVGNAMFDRLHDMLFGGDSHSEAVHDDRAGIAKAARALRDGGVVVIMPDAYRRERDTVLVPFHGYAMNCALGTAALARRTGAHVLPALSAPARTSLEFKTRFAPRVSSVPSGNPRHDDYTLTAKMFAAYEAMMGRSVLYWQSAGTHFGNQPPFPVVDVAELETLADSLFADPRLQTVLSEPIRLKSPMEG